MGDDASTNGDEERVPVQVGISVRSYSPTLYVPERVLEDSKSGNYEEMLEHIANWWDRLSKEERANALNLGEKDGTELVENLMFIDEIDEEGYNEPVVGW